jgi:5-methylcytosine-specific restriction endonuclease McrA
LPPPTPAEQIQFLTNLQRLLAEGLFTATYKYALLAALADLAVEQGDDSGGPLVLSTFAISEKFVEYYWRHATPYSTARDSRVLKQNTGSTAKILTIVSEARHRYGDSMASLMRDEIAWARLVRKFIPTLKEQPLWRLQVVGNKTLNFLYGPGDSAETIKLRCGVAYCFRQFYSLIQDVVRSAWLRDVRSLNGNLLGETSDLREFLFGAERSALDIVRPVMGNLQGWKCFYCDGRIPVSTGEVDHFIPWAKYPADLAHNFVLADRRCNGKKRDRMPHTDYLARWSERNRAAGQQIATALNTRFSCDLEATNRIAFWAYSQTEAASGLTWLRGDELLALSPEWRRNFVGISNS